MELQKDSYVQPLREAHRRAKNAGELLHSPRGRQCRPLRWDLNRTTPKVVPPTETKAVLPTPRRPALNYDLNRTKPKVVPPTQTKAKVKKHDAPPPEKHNAPPPQPAKKGRPAKMKTKCLKNPKKLRKQPNNRILSKSYEVDEILECHFLLGQQLLGRSVTSPERVTTSPEGLTTRVRPARLENRRPLHVLVPVTPRAKVDETEVLSGGAKVGKMGKRVAKDSVEKIVVTESKHSVKAGKKRVQKNFITASRKKSIPPPDGYSSDEPY